MEDLLRLPTSDEGAQQAVWDLYRSGKMDKTRLGEFLHNSAQAVVAPPQTHVVTKACLVSPSFDSYTLGDIEAACDHTVVLLDFDNFRRPSKLAGTRRKGVVVMSAEHLWKAV